MPKTVGVLSACSGDKEPSAVVDCREIDATIRETLMSEYEAWAKTAADLYTGDEHTDTKAAVKHLREFVDVEWRIVSAGFGLITPTTRLPSYNCTFRDDESVRSRLDCRGIDPSNYTIPGRITRLGNELGIPTDLRNWLNADIELLFVLLGSKYLQSVDDTLEDIPESTQAYAFAPQGSRKHLGQCEWVPSTETERDALSTLWTRLKGRQFRNLAASVSTAEELLAIRDVEELRARSLGNHT